MKAEAFYPRVIDALQQAPESRHSLLVALHSEIMRRYVSLIGAMTANQANQPSTDGRTVAQVIGHIAEWERYLILAAGEMLVEVEWPHIMTFEDYQETDGRILDFDSTDQFNAHQAVKHADWPWERIQAQAIRTAATLYTLFSHPALLSPERLEMGRPYRWRLPGDVTQTVAVGWYLWVVTLEHEAIEHAQDLGWTED